MTDIHKEIDSLKVKSGYSGKSQQWQYGFDLACRELAKVIPEGFVLMPKEPTGEIIDALIEKIWHGYGYQEVEAHYVAIYKAMIKAQESANESK